MESEHPQHPPGTSRGAEAPPLHHIKRWLTAPLALPDGTLQPRDRGTPQGSAVSPVLANLFMHYAFDMWMAREYPGVAFERYADDGVPRIADGGRDVEAA